MTTPEKLIVVLDGNEAAAHIAYKTNELCIIYPITPASTMGEFVDQWAQEKRKNIWGDIPTVVTMQSEGGAAGTLHGALQTGALATTFTASQGLLLMIPNMYRIAAELTPTVFHISCRAVAAQGMTIYCDHSDVMAARATGFAMLCSSNVQEVQDLALIAQVASLESRIPFLHFFDGFRTSHEVTKIDALTDAQIKKMISDDLVIAHRNRRLTSDRPDVRGSVQNYDTYFQGRESINPIYTQLPATVTNVMQKFKELTGRSYKTIEYFGASDAKYVITVMASGADTVRETVAYLNTHGEKVGLLQVRLFRPFPTEDFLSELPKTCEALAILDRNKEPGSTGEPLYQEIAPVLLEAEYKLKVIAGRFGIAAKEFTPAMVKAVFDELKKDKPKNHFTIGINDDLSNTSLTYDAQFTIEPSLVTRALFYGLGADGTVSANKSTIKILGKETDLYVQGYFVYDSKKSGSKTVSHLRFSSQKIYSTYLIQSANFIGCHLFSFIQRENILENASLHAVFLLNSPYAPEKTWAALPQIVQQTIIDKKIKFHIIDAFKVAKESGLGSRINTIMQTCFFALSKILPEDVAIKKIKTMIHKVYSGKGEAVVEKNYQAVDRTLANLFEVKVPAKADSVLQLPATVGVHAPKFVRDVIGKMIAGKGDDLAVSEVPNDGIFPSHTTRWEKRNISQTIPSWNPETCAQCGQCHMVCPHSIIRAKSVSRQQLQNAPKDFKYAKSKNRNTPDQCHTLQIYLEDCTGCGLCTSSCPINRGGKQQALTLVQKPDSLTAAKEHLQFFENLENIAAADPTTVRGVQYLESMFEFCGACTGCGESSYVRLLSQLFGDRLIIADACGCSLVYGGQLPTFPWTINKEGRGPAFAASLFEDNAEFGLGFSLTLEKHQQLALALLEELKESIGTELVTAIKTAPQVTSSEIAAQRQRVTNLKTKLKNNKHHQAQLLLSLADQLVKHSVWAIGGDGWAYDIGYGGLDHVLASGTKINVLVMDTEVYSNTGGQASKATPRGSVVKFAAQGKLTSKKDMGLIMMTYGNIYIASIALGANPAQALKAFQEAENYAGPSLILAYSPCIAHGINMNRSLEQQQLAVKSGYWPLYRYNPDRVKEGLNPFQLDSSEASIPFKEYAYKENRFRILFETNPAQAEKLMMLAEEDIAKRWKQYRKLLTIDD